MLSLGWFLVSLFSLFFRDEFSYSTGWPPMCYAAKDGLEQLILSPPPSQVPELQVLPGLLIVVLNEGSEIE